MGKELRGIKGKDAMKAFLRAGGTEKPGKGDHINIKMPNGMIITIPDRGELKVGLLRSAIHKAGLTEEQFLDLL
jgi:predicted RNA binding protein YcfA (HicA-like mRNA interferase family)